MRTVQWKFLLALGAVMALVNAARAARFDDVTTPMDAYEQVTGSSLDQIPTLLDRTDTAGIFPLGRALTTIGRADLTGVAFNTNTFEQSPLEGAYDAGVSYNTFEQPVGISSRRSDLQNTVATHQQALKGGATRFSSNRINRVSIRQ